MENHSDYWVKRYLDILTAQHIAEEGVSFSEVSSHLRAWGLKNDGIDKITIGLCGNHLCGNHYAIAFLMNNLSMEGIHEAYRETKSIRDLFGDTQVLLYPLGKERSDSFLLTSHCTVYEKDNRDNNTYSNCA